LNDNLINIDMAFLFDSFEDWKKYAIQHNVSLSDVVLEYEREQKNRTEEEIWNGLLGAWRVMKEAVHTGLEEDMKSRSGMIDNGGKKVYRHHQAVLSKEFQNLIARALAAKEVNSCMGRIVAAPTAGASGIMPGVLYTLQEIHQISDKRSWYRLE
jgi:L-serine dehydratase